MADSLGRTLFDARRQAGKTLTEAEEATRIRTKHLQALENGDYETLPDPAYTKGYLISYAKFLNMDPKPLLEQYRKEMGEQERPERAPRLPEPVVSSHEQSHIVPRQVMVVIIVIAVLAAGAFWGIGNFLEGEEELPPVPNIPEESTTTAPSAEETMPGVTDTETTEAQDGEVIAGEPFTLTVIVSETAASWLEIEVDGFNAYVGTLAAGQSKEWDVTESASILIGKPEAVTVFRDELEIPIPPGEVPILTLTTDQP